MSDDPAALSKEDTAESALVKDNSVEKDDSVKTREAAEQAQALDKLTDKVVART